MTTRIFRVRPLGLAPHELNALKSVCRLSQQPGRAIGHTLAEPGDVVDLFVVATEDPAAVAGWRSCDPQALRPFVAAGRMPPGMSRGVELPKPFLASRLLAAIDACAVRFGSEPAGAFPNAPPGRPAQTAQTVQAVQTAPGPWQAPPPQLPKPPPPPPPLGRSVLLVDDSPTILKQLELVIRDMGLVPHCVASGEEALYAIERHGFDLILLDVVLPGTDGYQVCKAIRKNPRTQKVPVVMLTSKSSPFDKIRGTFAGCDSYLTKPLAQADFRAAMHKFLPRTSSAADCTDPAPARAARVWQAV